MKVCTKCGEDQPKSNYYKHKDGVDGLRPSCKSCIAVAGKKYYDENREDCLRRTADWHKRNPEKTRAIQERYRVNNPESYSNKWIKRRTIKRALKYDFTPQLSKEIRGAMGRVCVLSGRDDTHLDHFIPMGIGHGGTYEGNLILLSSNLNLSKGHRNPFEWAETLSEEYRENFDKLVEYLAELNGLTVKDYREFVFWCFENKREVSEITEENKDSLNLWLRTREVA